MAETTVENFDEENSVTMLDVLQEENQLEEDANAVLGPADDKHCTYNKVRRFSPNISPNLQNHIHLLTLSPCSCNISILRFPEFSFPKTVSKIFIDQFFSFFSSNLRFPNASNITSMTKNIDILFASNFHYSRTTKTFLPLYRLRKFDNRPAKY